MVEGPANATVMIDGQRQGQLPASGRAGFSVTPDALHRIFIDDEDSLEILKEADRVVRLRDSEEVQVRFEAENLK